MIPLRHLYLLLPRTDMTYPNPINGLAASLSLLIGLFPTKERTAMIKDPQTKLTKLASFPP